MKSPYSTAYTVSLIEGTCLELRKQLCDGSLVQGQQAKPLSAVDVTTVMELVVKLQQQVYALENHVRA